MGITPAKSELRICNISATSRAANGPAAPIYRGQQTVPLETLVLMFTNSFCSHHLTSRQALCGGAEALRRAGFGFGGLVFAIAGSSCGFERAEETHGSGGNFVDGGVERFFVGLRWFGEAADFPDKLERSGAHFLGSNGRIEVKKGVYIS